jgi:hypothetical protein
VITTDTDRKTDLCADIVYSLFICVSFRYLFGNSDGRTVDDLENIFDGISFGLIAVVLDIFLTREGENIKILSCSSR